MKYTPVLHERPTTAGGHSLIYCRCLQIFMATKQHFSNGIYSNSTAYFHFYFLQVLCFNSYLQRRFFNNSNMEQLSSSLCLLPFLRFRVRSFPHFPLEANPFSLPESDHHCKLLCYAFLTHQQLNGAVYVWFSLIRECSKIKGIDILKFEEFSSSLI